MDVVRNGQKLVRGNVVGLEVLVEVVLGVLDLVGLYVVVVYSLVSNRTCII